MAATELRSNDVTGSSPERDGTGAPGAAGGCEPMTSNEGSG